MNVDSTLSDAIKKACNEEEISHASDAIIKFVERYISNELPSKSISTPLQDLYELIKD